MRKVPWIPIQPPTDSTTVLPLQPEAILVKLWVHNNRNWHLWRVGDLLLVAQFLDRRWQPIMRIHHLGQTTVVSFPTGVDEASRQKMMNWLCQATNSHVSLRSRPPTAVHRKPRPQGMEVSWTQLTTQPVTEADDQQAPSSWYFPPTELHQIISRNFPGWSVRRND